MNFQNAISNSSLFIFQNNDTIIYLLVYIDDIIITGNNDQSLNKCISHLASRFSLKDLGPLTYFLGVEVNSHPKGILLSQKRHIQDILIKANTEDSKHVPTPMPIQPPPSIHGKLLDNPTKYRALLGSLQYLSLTCPDISFTVNKLAQYMQRPTHDHLHLLHRLLRYLNGTLHMGIIIHANSPSSLHAFLDADWARDQDD